jgi:23S rRNA (uracil1939-C5)-methyltransferase
VRVRECLVSHSAFEPLFAEGASTQAPERFLAFATEAADGKPALWREDLNPQAEVRVTVLGHELIFPLRGFFQSNLAMLPKLAAYALEGLQGDTVFDLYAGAGLFGALLRSKFRRVVCVESDAAALACARRNLGAENAAFISGRLERAIMENPILRKEKPDAAVVDPPREGLASEVRAYLKEKRVPRLVYVSCNPVTLARDLKELLAGPYALEDLRLFDFFPHTSHVEAVAKLRLKS